MIGYKRVLNAAARVVCLIPKFDHITPVLIGLHWLPVWYRVIFKILLLVYKALHANVPPYISDLLTPKHIGCYSLRSNEQNLLIVPKTMRKTFGNLVHFCGMNFHAGLIRDTEGHDFLAVKYSKWPSWLFPDFQIKI